MITFVCCIEPGLLEPQSLRLIDSLRRFGGKFADAPFFAVQPRFGPPLARSTRRELERLGARHVYLPARRRYAWYHFTNKAAAVVAAEELATTEQVAFLDSDVLVLREPTEFELAPGEDFAACSPDTGVVGTTGPDSPYESQWRRIAEVLGINFDNVPWVEALLVGKRIRLYFNGGVFTYRRATKLGRSYMDACIRLLDAHLGFPKNGEHWLEQISLGLSMHARGLRWRSLPLPYNYTMASYLPHYWNPDVLRQTRVLHYHDSMGPHFFNELLERIKATQPDRHEWLSAWGPTVTPSPWPTKVAAELLRVGRGVPRWAYRRRAKAARRPYPAPTVAQTAPAGGGVCA
jgi:hypothetical protein